eukprot:CAMPEP_0179027932 /NCGR_PEP_ID=MMETSP0796-20121207/9290_1 /TAXON_ID=73915 /ORGANISM="Pyrodinium bahamense, Strain pbaha01" /LENGTH=113 /DNA_ID=CAMNT_0020724069 /DNA_START=69 /DNA_END=410 /DNA_ORIENTATION=+
MTPAGVHSLVRGFIMLGGTRLSVHAWDPSVAVDNDLAIWVCREALASLVSFRCGVDLLEDSTKTELLRRFPGDFYRRECGEVWPVDDCGGLHFGHSPTELGEPAAGSSEGFLS